MSRESEALDRHITGNYGEDFFNEWEDLPEPDCQVSNCKSIAEDGVLCRGHLAQLEAIEESE